MQLFVGAQAQAAGGDRPLNPQSHPQTNNQTTPTKPRGNDTNNTTPNTNTNRQVAGYSGLLLAAPTVLYEVIAYVVPGLTKSERTFLAPVVFGSSILFYFG